MMKYEGDVSVVRCRSTRSGREKTGTENPEENWNRPHYKTGIGLNTEKSEYLLNSSITSRMWHKVNF